MSPVELCNQITCADVNQYFFSISFTEFKECFSLYDKKQKGKIDAKDLITVMRCLGTSPTFSEIERHLQVHKIGKVQHMSIHSSCGQIKVVKVSSGCE